MTGDPPTPYDLSLWVFAAAGIGFVLAGVAWSVVFFLIRRDERP